MKIDDLRLFVYVARYGSFAAASRFLEMPPATLSRRIQKLEQDLNVKLMVRNARGLSLTNAGEEIWNLSSDSVFQLDALSDKIAEGINQSSGLISIAAPSSFISHELAPKLQGFLKKYPDIEIDFFATEEQDQSYKVFYNNSVDLVFRFGPQQDSGLIAKRLKHYRVWLMATADYIEQRGMPEKPEDLEQHDLLGFRSILDLNLKQGDFTYKVSKKPRVRAVDPYMISEFGRLGLGIFVMPEQDLQQEAWCKNLVRVLPDWELEGGDLHLMYSGKSDLPKRVRLLIDWLSEQFSDCTDNLSQRLG